MVNLSNYDVVTIRKAIDAEAAAWAAFFKVTDPEQIEGRRAVLRANVKAGHVGGLEEFLPAPKAMTPAQADRLCNETGLFVLVNFRHQEHYCGYVVDRDRRMIHVEIPGHGLAVFHRDEIDEWHPV